MTTHPKMIKNYFQTSPVSAGKSITVSTSANTSNRVNIPLSGANLICIKKPNCIVPKNLKRKIRDILEDENRRAAEITSSNGGGVSAGNGESGGRETETMRRSNVMNGSSTAAKKTRTCDVKVVTRINLPMAKTAVLRNLNTNHSTATSTSRLVTLNRILQMNKSNVAQTTMSQKAFLDVKTKPTTVVLQHQA